MELTKLLDDFQGLGDAHSLKGFQNTLEKFTRSNTFEDIPNISKEIANLKELEKKITEKDVKLNENLDRLEIEHQYQKSPLLENISAFKEKFETLKLDLRANQLVAEIKEKGKSSPEKSLRDIAAICSSFKKNPELVMELLGKLENAPWFQKMLNDTPAAKKQFNEITKDTFNKIFILSESLDPEKAVKLNNAIEKSAWGIQQRQRR